jgi:7-carboxy-7-deazaguanine synthase
LSSSEQRKNIPGIIGFSGSQSDNPLPEEGDRLPLMEAFYTIQGEGYNAGEAAFFIRLGGCDVGCVWCDVKESWNATAHNLLALDEIAGKALAYPSKTVVITGGEPLMYNLDKLCRHLKSKGIRTWLETSGAYPLTGNWDWICVSPKKFKAPLPEVMQEANELKVVIFNKSDFLWAEQQRSLACKTAKLFMQPEWSRKDTLLPQIIDYVKDHPEWRISLQTHKYMNIP